MRLLLVLLFINVSLCFAQSYKPLLDQTNQWHYTTCYNGCLTDVYYTNGDTIVDNKNYKILDGYHYISRTFLLREDISTKKVYLKKIFPTFNREFLLYDFSLNEGETIDMKNPLSPTPEDGGSFQLDSIRMKPLLNNIPFKHFYFSPTSTNAISSHNVVWVEGIGGKSIINAPSGEVDINVGGQLSCFFKNENLVYSELDSINACNYLPLKNETLNFSKVQLLKTNHSKIYQLIEAEKVIDIAIFSISGQKIKSIRNDKNSEIFLSFEEFQSGFYLVIVNDENNQRKVFKVNLD